jgi:hypothetical protein
VLRKASRKNKFKVFSERLARNQKSYTFAAAKNDKRLEFLAKQEQ